MRRVLLLVLAVLAAAPDGAAQSSDLELVDVREWMPDVPIEAPYAGPDNFFEQKLYTVDARTAYGTLGAIQALRGVRASLNGQGYDLKIWDFYRPLTVQWLMWSLYPDPQYVADPRSGSNHNRGAAVDVTLIDLATGEEVDMGTGFDDFSEAAGHGYADLPLDVRQRRSLLRLAMDNYNFSSYFAEWWHYTHNPSAADGPLQDYQMK